MNEQEKENIVWRILDYVEPYEVIEVVIEMVVEALFN